MYVRRLRHAALAAALLSLSSCGDTAAGRAEGDGAVIPDPIVKDGSTVQPDGGRGVDAGPVSSAVCGDGKRHTSEACDDGNLVGGDGCSADCKVLEPAYVCATPGSPCVDTSVCGDKLVSGREQCDDGNVLPGDGCTATCQIESGFACRVAGARCRAASCGDGIAVGLEECDVAGDGCDDLCRVEPGFVCPAGAACRATTCGDGVKEGSEQCDDMNSTPYDGCFNCQNEPDCKTGACTAVCGDGIKFPGEACDDGNIRDDDGCSALCQLEAGFACTLSMAAPPQMLDIPTIYRDFRGNDVVAPQVGHIDFQNKNGSEKGIVMTTLGADKKPQYAKEGVASTTTHGKMWFDMWYLDVPMNNKTVADKLSFTRQADGSYVFQNDDFFPLDGRGWTPIDDKPGDATRPGNHNFHFTSELRYWFEYRGGEKLDFYGDDDVWVFVNGKLALDLGGIHGAESGSVTLDPSGTDPRFSLQKNGIYEVVVFQAERRETRSQYKLTLRGFEKARSMCASICGDGVVTQDEICDDGKNDGSYGSCMPGCQDFGPYCGDKIVQRDAKETCDDGNKVTSDGCDNACNNTLIMIF